MDMKTSDGEAGETSVLGRSTMLADINITPFVDVMLVLLIIFMVTAPFAVSGVDIQLPKSKAKTLTLGQDPIVVSISSQGEFFLGKKSLKRDELTAKIQAALVGHEQPTVFIRADREVAYAKVMDAMAAAQAAGAKKIGMMGEGTGNGTKVR
ncbi:biopolymer transporter ExbD [bacterium]|nr:biopolymer transporter ExbD [bacterium]